MSLGEMQRHCFGRTSMIIPLYFSPYSRLAQAMMVDVFPVPGGPYNSKCGSLFLSIKVLTAAAMEFHQTKHCLGLSPHILVEMMSSWAIKSSSLSGRYFSTQGSASLPPTRPPAETAASVLRHKTSGAGAF